MSGPGVRPPSLDIHRPGQGAELGVRPRHGQFSPASQLGQEPFGWFRRHRRPSWAGEGVNVILDTFSLSTLQDVEPYLIGTKRLRGRGKELRD